MLLNREQKRINSVSEADGTRTAESLRDSLAPAPGGRPIRKRGYHRALKRGEAWARQQKAMTDMMHDLDKMFYRRWEEKWSEHAELFGLRGIVAGEER